ncbi:MAG: hypothetical protein JWR80_3635 [Bradyrhizobium sp.]|nr:hypothetical protein [Bradyrhizobium sp.]
MLVAAVAGYGRRAYGFGGCVNTVGSTYQCSGAAVLTQNIIGVNASNANVSTVAGFSVTTAAGNAITITGDGALSYTDTNTSTLTAAAGSALAVSSPADFSGTPGSITINTNGALSGSGNSKNGIGAYNSGTGAITITANGNVTGNLIGTNGFGIIAVNSGAGTDVTVTTGAGTTVSGATNGISGSNYGTGALTITANGDVTGTTASAINAVNYGTNLTVITGAGTTVSGASGGSGITANNQFGSTGALTITANGNVTGGPTGNGIAATNRSGTDLTVTTAAGTTVSGGNKGIYTRNYGTGATTITANGNVTSTNGTGIFAQNSVGTDLFVTTAAGTTVSGGTDGIYARNQGSGALTITANGDVTGTSGRGIYAGNTVIGTALSVTTAAGTTVSGSTDGIFARNGGTGALTITANGTVTGTSGDGINALSTVGAITITVAATGTVSSSSGLGIWASGRPTTVTVAGTVNGGAGGAIQFDQAGAFANRLDLVTGAVINGRVFGGLGTDTLGLSGTGSGSFNVGQLVSFEAGAKTGSGAWTLTGSNTGITAFSTSAGTLIVNGSLSNAAFTVTGGTLGGTGTIGNTLVSGGTFAPGSGTPGSLMTVNGTLGFDAASTYLVNVNPTTSSFANVSGAATPGGATVNAIFANGNYISKQYTILTAGSISGAFGTLTNGNLPANFHDTLSYDATHAYLNLALNFTTPAPGGLNGNQNNVANALTNYFNSNGGIPAVFGGLTANGLSQASGQPGASTAQAGIGGMGQFANAIFDGAFDNNGQGGASGFAAADEANAYAPKTKVAREAADAFAKAMPVKAIAPSFASRWAVWATAYGGNSRVNGDTGAGTSTTTSRVFGTAVGATYRFTPDTQAGFALGGAGSSFSLDGGFGGGKADVFNAAVYAKHNWGAAYVAGLLGYSWQDTTTDRTVTIAGTDQLRANFKAQALAARLEGGWRYATPMVGITPYAALQSTSFYLPSYGETATSGSSTFALNYAPKTVTATRGELGTKFDKAMVVQGGVFTLKAKTAWAHDWNTGRAATATFQTLPGATFTVNGAQPSANAALVSLGGAMDWHNGWTLAANFDGEFSRATASYAGKGSVRYAW